MCREQEWHIKAFSLKEYQLFLLVTTFLPFDPSLFEFIWAGFMLCSWLICASCSSVSLMSCTVETLLLLLFSIHYSMRHLLWLSQGSFLNSWISALFTLLILCDCFFLSRLRHWIRFPAARWPSSLTLVLPCMQPDQVWKLESWVCRLLAGGPAVSAKLWSPLLEYKSGI